MTAAELETLTEWPRTSEAARVLCLSSARLWQLARDGKLRTVRTRAGFLYDPVDLERVREQRARDERKES